MAPRKKSAKRSALIKGVTANRPISMTARNLARLSGLSELSADRLGILARRMTIRRFRRRSPIYREGQISDGMYIMLSGIARLTCLNRKDERILLEVLGPGDVVGIPSLLPDVRHNIRCDAFTDCQLGMISPKALIEDIVGLPFRDFGIALKLTLGRWWQLLVRHSNSIEQGLPERILIALLDLASKFGVRDARGTILNVHLTHQDIAELVNASRPRVTTYLKQLAREGVLIQEGRRIIILPNRLEAALSLAAAD
jgi:CRP/FNR family cyclic AMP-dependent transcriptional regulator